MKPFAVLHMNADNLIRDNYVKVHDDVIIQREVVKDARVTGFVHVEHAPRIRDNDELNNDNYLNDLGWRIWFADTESDANTIAHILAARHANNTFVVLASKMVCRSQPGPVGKSVFTEKGLVPQ